MGKIENDIEKLCIDLIVILNDLKISGKISEEEYKEYIKEKLIFISKHMDFSNTC
ncbi:hypothetical protein [Acidilutibacter cellobiosedens]|jgi:hypothetical protein|uniref:hypothetical protein n=1 Tax=Acidilutibacter cellobiosedens TaxID=2507161 RepID=UPI0013762986|nr:hypothetical protein [Acidilutibacter cellobiosedens]